MAKRYWRVRGYRRLIDIFDVKIPFGSITERQVQELLRCLAASGSLSPQEIVGAYVKRKTKIAHDVLAVHRNGPYPEYSCGNDPSFTAIIVDEKGDRITYPTLL
jgi:hypothetical protein